MTSLKGQVDNHLPHFFETIVVIWCKRLFSVYTTVVGNVGTHHVSHMAPKTKPLGWNLVRWGTIP